MDVHFFDDDNNLSLGNLFIFLGTSGPHMDPEINEAACRKGLSLLEYFDVIPSRNTPRQCPVCGVGPMGISEEASRNNTGWRYRCNGLCPRNRRAKVDPLKGTVLEKTRVNEIGAQNILLIFAFFVLEIPLSLAQELCKASKDSLVYWFKHCRDITSKVAAHDYELIGGLGDIVEVDETLLFRRKNNVGRMYRRQLNQSWLFGGVSRTSGKVFGKVVPDRKKETLINAMIEYIDDDSFINSDMWRAYRGCDNYFRGHGVVNHSENFIEPPRDKDPIWVEEGYFNQECLDKRFVGPPPPPSPPNYTNLVPVRWHTQHVERCWRELKRIVAKCNNLDLCETFVGEWVYRENSGFGTMSFPQRFRRFLRDVRRAYPGLGCDPMSLSLDQCSCPECV